jgi:hypothetical protein
VISSLNSLGRCIFREKAEDTKSGEIFGNV